MIQILLQDLHNGPAKKSDARHGYPVDWSNHDNNVEITLMPESFRPNVPWTSNQDDYVLLARDPQADAVAVTWVLTEDGNDAVTRGKLKAPTGDLTDVADLFKIAFLKGA